MAEGWQGSANVGQGGAEAGPGTSGVITGHHHHGKEMRRRVSVQSHTHRLFMTVRHGTPPEGYRGFFSSLSHIAILPSSSFLLLLLLLFVFLLFFCLRLPHVILMLACQPSSSSSRHSSCHCLIWQVCGVWDTDPTEIQPKMHLVIHRNKVCV